LLEKSIRQRQVSANYYKVALIEQTATDKIDNREDV